MARMARKKRRLPRGLLLFAGVFFAVGIVAMGAVVSYYDRLVRKRMDGRKWNLPARIYSDVWVVRQGDGWSPEDVLRRLQRLRYAALEPGTKIEPGRYSVSGNWIAVWLKDRETAFGRTGGIPIEMEFEGSKIRTLRRAVDKVPLSLATFEPEVVGSVFDQKMEDRTPVRLDQVSPRLVDAIITTEDRSFYSHSGISLRRILGAALRNLRRGSAVQGGSTLTQQLVKNLFLTHERTFRRKAVEALLAVILEVRYEKEQILEAYLNEIYLGQRGSISVTGVEEASKYYFGKPASALNLPESALLAGLIASPGRFSPFRSEESARTRRAFVLKGMLELEKITKEEYENAAAAPLTAISRPATGIQASHFVDFVLTQAGQSREKISEEGVSIFTTLDPDMQTAAEAALQKGLEQLETKFKRLRTKPGQEPLQGALIALDPATGAIRALVGGRDYSESQFNRVVQARRQPGSLFKPFVFLAAFSDPEVRQHMTPSTVLQDSPISIEFGGGQQQIWTPKNYDGEFRGPISVRQTLEQSINIPTVRVALSETSSGDNLLPRIVELAKEAGISSPMKAYPSLALGSFEISPMEIAASYAVFANGGYRVKPTALLGAIKPGGDRLAGDGPKAEPMHRAAEAASAALVTEILRGAVERGTGASARRLGATGTFAGKTGTTNDGRDAWFIGFSPRLLVAVWVGFDDNRGLGLSGSMAAVPIFAEFARRRPSHEFNVSFVRPPGIVQETVDPTTGFLASENCPSKLNETYLAGTEPAAICPVHGARPAPEPREDVRPGLLPPQT